MKLLRILPLVVGSAVAGILASTSPAHALTTWSFSNATFANGARLTGSFNYDETNTTFFPAAYSSVNITLLDNLGTTLATYGTANVNLSSSNAMDLYLNNGVIGLRVFDSLTPWFIPPASPVPFANGQTSYGFGTAPGFTPIAFGASGSVISSPATAVPFDIPGGATIPTVGSLLALAAMRKVRKSIASKTSVASPATVS